MKFELVVLGASWGGLHAVQVVLGALPKDFPLPVVIVQHRERSADETLVMLLQQKCALPVSEAEDKQPIEPGHVYLAPAEYHLLIEGEIANTEYGYNPQSAIQNQKSKIHFALSTDAPVNYARPSIDVLFESAAEACGERVIGVILTGANADGAQGLAAIKHRGGLTLAQDPATAEAPTMPEAASALGVVDRVSRLEEIGRMLVEEIGQRMRLKK